MGRRELALVLALAVAAPALAQVKVARAPAAPTTQELAAEQRARFARTAGELNVAADGHDQTLAAFAAACPRMPKEDPRLPACMERRSQVLHSVSGYNAALKAYREDARVALQAAIDRLGSQVAETQQAIRNLRFDTTASAYEDWEKLSQEGKDAMVDEAMDAAFEMLGPASGFVGDKLGKVFDARVSDKLVGPLSLNPWNVNTQIKELQRLKVNDPELFRLMREVAGMKDKRAHVDAVQKVFKHAHQVYKEDKAVNGLRKTEGWRQRNWALASVCLTFLSEDSLILPDRATRWLASPAGKRIVGTVKAANSALNVAGNYALLHSLTTNLGAATNLPEEQLAALARLDERLTGLVRRRNDAKAEIARFS